MAEDKAETPPPQEIEAEYRKGFDERAWAALHGNRLMLEDPDRAVDALAPMAAYLMSRSVDRQEASMQRQEALMKDMHRQSKTMTCMTKAVVGLTIVVVLLSGFQVWSILRGPGGLSSQAASVVPPTQPAQLEGP